MDLSLVIFDIFHFENFEIRIRGHSRSSKLVAYFNRLVMVISVKSKTLFLRHTVFDIFTFEKYRDLETEIMGH